MNKLLGIFAHPDDESVIAGGTMAKYHRAGWQVDLVCATRGDAGERGDVSEKAGLLTEIRSKELEAAGSYIGIKSITHLDLPDGKLSVKHPGEIEAMLVDVFNHMMPDVVITHEPSGITHHPDHIKMSLSTTFAFQTYAMDRNELNSEDPNPPKLYYGCVPSTIVSYVQKSGYFPEELFSQRITGVDDKRISTVISIKSTSAIKRHAIESHVTQRHVLAKYLDIPDSPFLSQEYFILRYEGIKETFMGKNDRISDRI